MCTFHTDAKVYCCTSILFGPNLLCFSSTNTFFPTSSHDCPSFCLYCRPYNFQGKTKLVDELEKHKQALKTLSDEVEKLKNSKSSQPEVEIFFTANSMSYFNF